MQYARSKVDYVIEKFIYMLPSDMNLLIGKIKNYNNKILISSSSFNIGTNLKINLDDDKHIEKDRPNIKSKKEEIIKTNPDIKSKKEDKQDIEMMKTEPDMNEITYEEEKAALINIRNNIYLYSMMDIQMISSFLLVFVIKYVYIKTPTPVISVHKF